MLDILTDYDSVVLLACGDQRLLINGLKSMDIDVRAIDYNPRYYDDPGFPNYETKDFIFDDVDLDADIVVHFNCEKTYPIECQGDVLLIGDDQHHNGDCNPITSCQQLIDQNNLKEVYSTNEFTERGVTHYYVHGRK
jgi:hypothetical protein